MPLDQQKLVTELRRRADRDKDLAKTYRDADEPKIADEYMAKARTYEEVAHDVDKGKFKEKKPK